MKYLLKKQNTHLAVSVQRLLSVFCWTFHSGTGPQPSTGTFSKQKASGCLLLFCFAFKVKDQNKTDHQ